MIKPLCLTLILAIGGGLTQPALAALPGEEPPNMTQAHVEQAAQAHAYEQKVGQAVFRVKRDAMAARWTRYRDHPVSNMTAPALRKLLVGNYMIHSNPNELGHRVLFHGSDGTLHVCDFYKERYMKGAWAVLPGVTGTTVIHGSPQEVKDTPWASYMPPGFTYNQRSGEFHLGYGYAFDRYGWVQAELPAAAASICPEMPQKALVNEEQMDTEAGLRSMAAVAKPIRGIPTIFNTDVRDPLTTWMYLYAYPYESNRQAGDGD